MQPNNQPQPIRDVTPSRDSLGNAEGVGAIPVRQAPDQQAQSTNPLMASRVQPAAQAPPVSEAPQPMKTEDIENVLKEVNQDVKQTEKKPVKPPKAKSAKPVIAITLAVILAAGLCYAAYLAFKSSN